MRICGAGIVARLFRGEGLDAGAPKIPPLRREAYKSAAEPEMSIDPDGF
jgi:hypothetical protein